MRADVTIKTGRELRALARNGRFDGQTAGQAPDYLQGNVVILSRKYAADFLQFCLNNPKPCPLVGLSAVGKTDMPSLGDDIDMRFDIPMYRIYRDGTLDTETSDIARLWQDDFVTFVLGCSFTFEQALIRAGHPVRHIELGRNVPMFKTSIETIPGGVFKGPLVVTMRPYPRESIPAIYDLCAAYSHAHGTPIYWGDPGAIGITDLQNPDYGDPVAINSGETPVFWACGVTPQAAIEAAQIELSITHKPGCMLVTDLPSTATPVVRSAMGALSG